MSENRISKKSKASPETPSKLKRRGIHEKAKNLDENSSDENCDSEKDSPQVRKKSPKLYPDISDGEPLSKELQEIIERKGSKNTKSKATNQQIPPFGRFFIPYCYTIFIVGVVGFFIISFIFSSKERTSEMTVEEIITNLQSNFKNQNPLTFRALKKGLKKVVNHPNPSAPAIFTIAANKNAKLTASEFSLYLAKSLVSQRYVLINDSMYWHSNSEDIMFRIDEEIKSNENKSKLNVVVVDNLQNIPYEAAMIFHTYCDHLLAPFKQAIFLFNVPLDIVLAEDANSKIIDENAMKQLRNIWYRASDDIIDSLITRITVNVINIR